jgi:hypothetical protein
VRGALAIHVRMDVEVDPSLLVDLAVDLDALLALHPRVVGARWLDEPVRPGSRAEITVEIPPSLSLLRPIVGIPQGVLTLLDHQPGERARYRLDATRVAGEVELVAGPPGDGTVAVSARLWPRSPLARVAFAPSASVAEVVMTRSARRTLARADATLISRTRPVAAT